jgi:HK97 family phage major capsid protein
MLTVTSDEARRQRADLLVAAQAIMSRYPNSRNVPRFELARAEDLRDKAKACEKFMDMRRMGSGYDAPFAAYISGRALSSAEQRALSIGLDPAGGFAASDGFSAAVIAGLDTLVPMRQFATVEQAGGSREKIPVVESVAPAEWVPEGGSFTPVDDTFSQRILPLHKVGRVGKASIELAADGGRRFEALMERSATNAIALAEDEGFVNGNGIGQPRGVLLDAEVGVTAAGTTTVTADELIDLQASVTRPYRIGANWIASSATVTAISKLKSAAGDYLGNLLRFEGGRTYLLGSEVLVSDGAPDMAASARSIGYGSLAAYHVCDGPGGIYVQILRELFAEAGQLGFLYYRRTSGRLILPAAVKCIVMHA